MQAQVDPHLDITETFQHAGLAAQRTRSDQVCVSAREIAADPDKRKSFWLSQAEGTWYLSTWLPVRYRVPPNQDILALCSACVEAGTSPGYRVPAEIVARFKLQEIDARQYERLFPTEGWND